MANRLQHATSPYLLQHAQNPVDWYEWGVEALQKAISEDKPILVSIGYSSCHWCHVMEHESFENEDIAQIMNEHFVCIKVDREERPDIDHVYMEAIQAMGQNGGWPLNIFLTPDQQPFYGGTYFPPQQWAQLLLRIHRAFAQQRSQIEASAQDLTLHLQKNDIERFGQVKSDLPGTEVFDQLFSVLVDRFDSTYGGLDKAPKFVMPSIWQLLLRHYRQSGQSTALEMVIMTLRQMAQGGLYDQVRGGFARYSVDARWFAPHFEKMLYDNGQLLSLYAEGYRVTRSPLFATILRETTEWLTREMRHPEGGFYSALDADSEGMEGKYYTWTFEEWQEALGNDAANAARYYGIKETGNWEHGRNILTTPDSLPAELPQWKAQLLKAMEKRVRPGLDDKILTGWNAITIKGLIDAYEALGEPRLLNLAQHAMQFLERHLRVENTWYRSWKGKRSGTEGFLEDYAFVIQAYVTFYQATFEEEWLRKAIATLEHTISVFFDPTDGFFRFSSATSEKLIASKKEVFDNVIPAGNSVMVRNLLQLSVLLDRGDWKEKAHHMLQSLAPIIIQEPAYLSNWAMALGEAIYGLNEVAIVGPDAIKKLNEWTSYFEPFALRLGTTRESTLPLLADKLPATDTRIFVCKDRVCQLPVSSVDEARIQLR